MSIEFDDPRAFEADPVEDEGLSLKDRDEALQAEAMVWEPIRDYTSEPGWQHLDEMIAEAEAEALDYLVNTARTEEEMWAYRARVRALRWVRDTPERVLERLGSIRSEQADLDSQEG